MKLCNEFNASQIESAEMRTRLYLSPGKITIYRCYLGTTREGKGCIHAKFGDLYETWQ